MIMRINKLSLLFVLSLIFSNYCFSQSLESSKELYLNDGDVKESITITFSEGPGNNKDWIGVYQIGQVPGDVGSTIWSYVDGTKSGDTGKSDGVIVFEDVLEVGSYKAYFLEDDGYNILATTSFVVTADKNDLLPEGVYFQEDFDGVELGAFVSDSESNGDGTDWAAQGPSGWVMRKNAGHGPTDGGDDVVEFDGWTFLDPVSWNATAGQDRSLFSKGSGVIAVADSDEYDDKADAKFNASLSTPSIDISKASVNTLILQYDSSWRKEPQTGSITVSYDGGEEIELLSLDGNNADALNETIEIALKNPSGAKSAVISWNYQGYNNWWWAIDNIRLYEKILENNAPIATDQIVSVNEDGSVEISLSASDKDEDDLTFTVLTQPKNGTLTGNAPVLVYVPSADFFGPDSFTFKADDGIDDSNTSTISIVVESVNDTPVVVGQSVSVFENQNVNIILTGSDVDGDELTFSVVSEPANGTLSGAAPSLLYTPNSDHTGIDSFTFKANDGTSDSSISTISIDTKPDVKLSSETVNYESGDDVLITFSNARGNKHDVIGIYKAGSDAVKDWPIMSLYVGGTLAPTEPLTQGAVLFKNGLEQPGSYFAVYFHNADNDATSEDFEVLAKLDFTVSEKSTLPEGVYFEEDFDGVELGAFVSDSESNGDGTDWAAQGPSGWVMRKNAGHGPTDGGDDVVEFDGWTFLDPVSWNATAGQDRSLFSKGSGVIAVADSDEYDDKADAKFNASLSTPSIDISKASVNTLILQYDSSWRKEPQTGSVTVSYDGGEEIELLSLDGNNADALNETVELALKNPSGAKSAVISWNYQGYNNWWWAIDNIRLYEKKGGPEPDDDWTILVYGHGDHNLTASLFEDMLEMEAVGSGEGFNIVVQADFNPKAWKPGNKYSSNFLIKWANYIPENVRNSVSRWRIGNDTDGDFYTLNSKPLEFIPETENMDSSKTLTDFINWAADNYPAKRYGIVFWDHGGQWTGFGGDGQNGTYRDLGFSWANYGMKTKDMRSAIDSSSINKFDFLGFDTCLMAGVEVIADFNDISDVYIACAELDYGDGWDYRTLRHIKNDLNISSVEFGKREVDDWNAHHSRWNADKQLKNHASFDMRKYDDFNASFIRFSELLSASNDRNEINRARRDAIHYSLRGVSEIKNPTDYIDLGHFAITLGNLIGEGQLKNACDDLVKSIQNMIINQASGASRKDSIGLSVYYPSSGYINWKYELLNFAKDNKFGGVNWLGQLARTKNAKINDIIPPDVSISFGEEKDTSRGASLDKIGGEIIKTSYDKPITIQFDVTDSPDAYEAFAALVTNEATDNPNQYLYLGEVESIALNGSGKYDFTWNGTLPVISQIGSESKAPPIGSSLGEQREGFEGEFPVYLGGWYLDSKSGNMISFFDYQSSEESEKVPLILITNFDDNGIGVIDTILNDTGEDEIWLSPTVSDIELEEGGKLWPVYYTEELTEDDEWETYFTYFEDGYISVPENGKDGLTISWNPIEAGNYGIELQTFDNLGNGSDVIEIEIEVGNQSQELPKLTISQEGNLIVLSWPIKDLDNMGTLQFTDKLGGEWIEVQANNVDFGGDGRIYKEKFNEKSKFYRLIGN